MVLGEAVESHQRVGSMELRFIKDYRQGEVVFDEGSRGREMYVVHTGEVRIVKKDSSGKEAVLSVLGPGEIFGEMALLDQKPRSATAIAVKDGTRLVALDRTRFTYLLRHEPEFAFIVMETLCRRIREKNAQYAELLEEP
jgi:CRP/FNR family cyclic AMP-dependent transcriptional regulator